jgi:hypothetical protein
MKLFNSKSCRECEGIRLQIGTRPHPTPPVAAHRFLPPIAAETTQVIWPVAGDPVMYATFCHNAELCDLQLR